MANSSEIWAQLEKAQQHLSSFNLAQAFKEDKQRASTMTLSLPGLHLDYSKNIVDNNALGLLCQLCDSIDLRQAIDDMFTGKKINNSEGRAVLHTALRAEHNQPLLVDDIDIHQQIQSAFDKMFKLCDDILQGEWVNEKGKRIENIVNIGIGGSDLGPHMVCEALKPFSQDKVSCYFVSNVDATHLVETLKHLTAEKTLFIIASKTFTTLETLSNATQAKEWLLSNGVKDVGRHMIAVTSAPNKAKDFGVKHCLEMFNWVGGRYSLWSTIGFSIALSIGVQNFKKLLNGAKAMDEHFRSAPWQENMPVIMALLGVWYRNFFAAESYAVIPYNQYLHLFCDFLQQLDMESNGKSIHQDGHAVDLDTGPIIWGGLGTNSQHAFHQLLHQGTSFIPVDFIATVKTHNPLGRQNAMLYANCLSQSQALMVGKSEEQAYQECMDAGMNESQAHFIAKHKTMPGNRPSNTLVMQDCDPYTLGMLIALYEHKVFVQGKIWHINSFDQWGVELGKQITKSLLPILEGDKTIDQEMDGSTQQLIRFFMAAD